MRAVQVSAHGGAEALQIVDLPEPEPGPGQVLVHVTHVGLNHLDVWVRRGVPGHSYPLPLIPGSDVVGTRDDTGEAVVLHPGVGCGRCGACLSGRHDLCRTYGIRGESFSGGLCQRVVVDARELLPCPIAPEKAAALPLSLLTAWHMLMGRARVRVGDHVLVQGGAGGVGSLAIQVARLAGARVAATASTEAKRERCRELGAEAAWSYDDVVASTKAWTERRGADIVVEHVGADTWPLSMRAVRWGGTVVTCGATTGHQVELDLRALFFKQLSLLGSTMGSMGEMVEAWAQVTAGHIDPVVDRVMPATQVAEAHRLLEAREVAGKIVLAMDL